VSFGARQENLIEDRCILSGAKM